MSEQALCREMPCKSNSQKCSPTRENVAGNVLKGNADDISWVMRSGPGDDARWELRDFVAQALDPEALHAASEGVGVQVEDPRCTVWALHYPSTLSQSCQDVMALRVAEGG